MRKDRVFFLAITLLTILFMFSCSQYSPVLPSEMAKSETWEDLFKALWTGLSDNYVFWDIDDANGEWDKVYEEYLPKFQELGAIDTRDEEATKKGTILLFDSVKNLSDGHFNIRAFGAEFYPSNYRIMKENNPEMTEEELMESFDDLSYYDLLPEDMSEEHAKSIMKNTFKIPLTVDVSSILSDERYSSLFFKMRPSGDINPKIQIRTRNDGESVILYSKSHPFGSLTTMYGEIKYFENEEQYNNPELILGETGIWGCTYGPYYPISDLDWDSSSPSHILDDIFSDWTLCLTFNSSAFHDGYSYKKYVSLNLCALAGITNGTEGIFEDVNYSKNTVYFLSSNFDFYTKRYDEGMKAFLKDFHDMKMNENAEGMILDMRGNTGGYNIDRELLFGDMFQEPQLFGYQKNKTGSGRSDYSLEFPLYIHPEGEYYDNEFSDIATKPVAVVTNTGTVSNGEMTVFMVRTLKNGGQVGGKTLGGTGTLSGDMLTANSGTFSVGDYITSVYTPYGNIRDVNHVSYEGIGLTPDAGYEVKFNLTSFETGKDARLEKAFEWIKDHR